MVSRKCAYWTCVAFTGALVLPATLAQPAGQPRERQADRDWRQERPQQAQPAGQQQQQGGASQLGHAAKLMKMHGSDLQAAIRQAESRTNGTAVAARAMVESGARGMHDRATETGGRPGMQAGGEQLVIEVLTLSDAGELQVVYVDGRTGDVRDVRTATRLEGWEDQRVASGESDSGRQPYGERQQRTGMDRDLTLVRATKLTGADVRDTTTGDEIGDIDDLAVRPQHGRVAYAVVGVGGTLGWNQKMIGVPMDEFQIRHTRDDGLQLVVSADELKRRPGIESDKWPASVERSRRGGEQAGMRIPAGAEEGATGPVAKASELIGRDVRSADGEDVGSIEDLFIDANQSRITAFVLSHGGFLGIGDKLIAVPWDAVTSVTDDEVRVKVASAKLKAAPTFESKDWTRTEDPAWLREVYQYFDARPYWEEDGSGMHQGRMERQQERRQDRPQP